MKSFSRSSSEESHNTSICYYSNFRIFSNNIVQELYFCQRFRSLILSELGNDWEQLASQIIYITRRSEKIYATVNFVIDSFIFSWLNYLENDSDFSKLITTKFQNFQYQIVRLNVLIQAFFETAKQVTEKLNKEETRTILFNNNIKPLFVFKEINEEFDFSSRRSLKKVKNENDQLTDMVSKLTLDEGNVSATPEKKQRAGRSSSDMQSKNSYISNKSKMKKLAKQYQKLTRMENYIDLPEKSKQQRWQVAKTLVVMIWEVQDSCERQEERIRFIQPAEKFYRQCLKLWMLEKSANIAKISFNQFVFKAKYFFGHEWNDEFLIPLFTLFQTVEQILIQSQSENPQQNKLEVGIKLQQYLQLIYKIIFKLHEQFAQIWEQNITDSAKYIK